MGGASGGASSLLPAGIRLHPQMGGGEVEGNSEEDLVGNMVRVSTCFR